MKMPAILSKREKAPILAVALLLLIAAAVVVIIQLRPGRPAGENSIAVSSELRRGRPAGSAAGFRRGPHRPGALHHPEYGFLRVYRAAGVSMAQVLYDPQYTEEGIYFSFRSVSPEQDGHVLYGLAFWPGRRTRGFSDRSYISMTGTLLGDYSYVDSYQFQDRGPALYLTELSLSSYGEIFAPAIITLFPQGQQAEHDGCTMCLERAELRKRKAGSLSPWKTTPGSPLKSRYRRPRRFRMGSSTNCPDQL